MRNLLAFLAAALLAFAGIGWYLGWYSVQKTPAAPGHQSVSIDIDKSKIGKDIEKGEEKIHEVLEKSTKSDGSKSPEPSKTDPPKSALK